VRGLLIGGGRKRGDEGGLDGRRWDQRDQRALRWRRDRVLPGPFL